MQDLSSIRNVVFAGGGNRCFWQAGFWRVVAPATGLAPSRVASVSAGAALSCAILADCIDETVEITCNAISHNPRNQYWGNLLRSDPVFPHAAIYRQILLQVMDDAAFQRLRQGPENRIEISRIPTWLSPRWATLLGIGAYQLEKQWRHPVHPTFGRRLGFRAEFFSAGDCESREQLADLILASSCTPPFTPLSVWKQQAALDGGLVDNVPVEGVGDVESEQSPTLVLLTRPYRTLPRVPGRYYVQPSEPPPVSSWDYTDPAGIRAAYALGKRDGEAFLSGAGQNHAEPKAVAGVSP